MDSSIFVFSLKKRKEKETMKKSNITNFIKNTQFTLSKHSPAILTGLGIAGMITTTVIAVKATPKAIKICEAERLNRINDYKEEPTKLDYVKACWKCYIPAAVTGTVSIACLVGGSSVNIRRNAALATAYKLSETALTEYRDKVVETIGEKKEKTVREAVAKEQVKKNPVREKEIIVTGNGDSLCFDPLSSRYFMSNIENIKRAENAINKQMLQDIGGYASINDFYDEIGLARTEIGNYLGWNSENLIDLDIGAHKTEDGKPSLVIGHYNRPRYDYDR